MTLNVLTVCLGLALLGLGVTLFRLELWGGPPPPGDRTRRGRRLTGALLVGALGCGLVGWELIDPRREPLLFLNASAALLLLVALLVMIGLWDLSAINAAARHRRLSILTKELYGISLREMKGRDAERAGREALKQVMERRESSGKMQDGEPG